MSREGKGVTRRRVVRFSEGSAAAAEEDSVAV
jgi:hypothetical protein